MNCESKNLKLIKSIESYYKQLNSESIIFSNLFEIQWLVSKNGIISHLCKIGQLKNEELEDEIDYFGEIECFKEFVEIFSVCFIYSRRSILSELEDIKLVDYNFTNLLSRISEDAFLSNGISKTFSDLTRIKKAIQPDFFPL
jgi:hypothetical protein